MKPTIQPIKGTRDYYPEEMALRNWLYETARAVSESFGYQEWDAPFLESIDLYAAKSGEELVKEQSFVFPDRGGDLITLRPELTPSLARLVAQRQRQLVYPLRWWTWGPCWRYEKPQKGRTREFFQWNIDLIGVDSPEADAELVAIAAAFLHHVGLEPKDVQILVNNRRHMETLLKEIEIPAEKRTDVFQLIDRREKMSAEAWHNYAQDVGLSQVQFDGLVAILENGESWRQSDEMKRFFEIIDAYGARDYVRFDPHIIRGLLYYTGTVFEAKDNSGEFRSILGGGRYDNLVADVGGTPLSAVGFAMGDLVISLALKKFGCLPERLGQSPAQVLVTVFDETSLAASFRLAGELRQAGLRVACYPEAVKLARQMKYADAMGIPIVLVCGPDEQVAGTAAIKNLRTGEQKTTPRISLVQELKQILA